MEIIRHLLSLSFSLLNDGWNLSFILLAQGGAQVIHTPFLSVSLSLSASPPPSLYFFLLSVSHTLPYTGYFCIYLLVQICFILEKKKPWC